MNADPVAINGNHRLRAKASPMLRASIKIALRSLRAHRLRSALTMLGIIIGVAAVVVMVAVGDGAREHIATQIRSLGTNLIGIHPGSITMKSVRLGKGA